MCKFCENQEKVVDGSVGIEKKYNMIVVKVRDEFFYANVGFKINFCPMCGKEIK